VQGGSPIKGEKSASKGKERSRSQGGPQSGTSKSKFHSYHKEKFWQSSVNEEFVGDT